MHDQPPRRSLMDAIRGAFTSPADRALRAMAAQDTVRASAPTGGRIALPPRRSYSRGIDEALDADPGRWISIFREAEQGRVSRMIDGYKSTRVLDDRLDVVCAKRVTALTGKRIVWKPPPGFEQDADAKRNSEMVARCWNSTLGTGDFLDDMAHAFLEGHAVAEKEWVTDLGTGWTKPIPLFVHPNRIAWNDAIEPCLCTPGVDSHPGTPLSRYPHKFFFFAPRGGRSDYPWRRGAMRSRVIGSTLKRFTTRAWIAMIERWGQPQVVAYSDEAENVSDIVEALRNLGLDWRAVLPTGTDIKEIPVTVADELHKKFVDHQNASDAISILGQNLTTEAVGGSFAAAAAHMRVGIEILLSDSMRLAEFLTDQYASELVMFNAPGTPVPYAEIVLVPPREWTVQEWQAGLCSADEYRQSAGHDLEPEVRTGRYFTGTSAAPGSSAGPEGGEPAKPSDTGDPGPSKT